MAAKEPLLQEDGDVSFESISSVSSEDCHEAPQVIHESERNEYHVYFLQVLGNLLEESNMQLTKRGQKAAALGKFILNDKGGHESCFQATSLICSRVAHLLPLDNKGEHTKPKQLAATIRKVWKNFHKLRFSDEIHQTWQNLLTSIQTPPSLLAEADLLCQLLLDRLLKFYISQGCKTPSPSIRPPTNLSIREKNVVRYIAGYVIRKLKDRYKEIRGKNEEVQKKRDQFLQILTAMESSTELEESHCAGEWTELIDRGGLYHVTDDAYHIMEAIEIKTKYYLEQAGIKQEAAIQGQIASNILGDPKILTQWDYLAAASPAKSELLGDIVTLWTTVRCFSFVKNWNDITIKEKFKKHGTRKTLK